MGQGIKRFYVHTIQVETWLGATGYGADTFAAPQNVVGFLSGTQKLVRAANGDEVVSASQFYTDIAKQSLFMPNSRVTANGAVSRVISANANDSAGLLPDHLVANLE